MRLTSEPAEAAGGAGGSPLPPGSPPPPGAALGTQSKKASASTEAGAGGMLFTNDSMLLSQEMSGMSQLAMPQNPRLSNNSTLGEEGGQSGGGEEARDYFAMDGLATLSDWEIQPGGERRGSMVAWLAVLAA